MTRLMTGERFFRSASAEAPARGMGRKGAEGVDEGNPVYAFANHGRWMAQCPFCKSAQVAFEADRRFLCAECGNGESGGKALPVVWPDDRARLRIEAALAPRPRDNRNWVPGETASQLEAENRLHGVAA